MADLVPHIYHETQEAGSMLCGQHALNNLLQSSLFTAPDLADIARQLDALEQAQLDPGVRLRGDEDGLGGSANYDDSGFFSVQVMEDALKVLGLSLVRWGSKEMAHMHNHPENMEGFLLNHQLHWFSVRRFGTADRFYNLDSCIPQPQWVSAMYLGLTLREAERQGYSIFAVVPSPDAGITGLPPCSAANHALALPEPRGTDGFPSHHGNGASASTSNGRGGSHTYFGGNGQSLAGGSSSTGFAPSGSSSASAAASSARKGKRPASMDAHRMDEDGDGGEDDVVIVEGPAGGSSASTSTSGRHHRQRRRVGDGPLRDAGVDGTSGLGGAGGGPGRGQEMSEEDQMAAAIAASLRVSSSGTSDAGGSSAGGAGNGQQRTQSRAAQSEEDEFQRALQASLAEAGGAQGASEEPEEEDSPSLEELRRRRAARFG
ncbi:hypothetical protein JCM8208_003201 [Rhodotorula glutinis]